ncbi:MAG TPA: DUF1015 domain-containing protein [Thermoanaerobaculia bacterium]|nr:DUF1015 domain-containing protein [Thermoanaerobaculia bacterium]HUM29506.1 DUF1015 domain-containing protein [Thermoanaerobaculia bacterium]HXK67889.1 DUF1015 domain-containing protein [Thermoanaerobaculia bacterium]
MSTIKPFRALRPRKDLAERVAAPPYDVVNTKTAMKMAEGNPLSFLRIARAEIDLPPGTDLYDASVYAMAGENLQRLVRDGIMVQDPTPCLYLYRQTMDGRTQLGLVTLVSAVEYDEGKIKIHEKTLKRKEDDRVNYILGTRAHNEPVFLSFRATETLRTLMQDPTKQEPEYDFTTDDQFGRVRHEFWVVDDENAIKAISDAFSTLPALYVADGHHRSASAWRVWKQLKSENPNHTGQEEYNFFMAVVFPHDELFIYDYNRVIRDLGGLSPEKFFEKACQSFTVSTPFPSRKPAQKHEFGMYMDGTWHLLTARPGSFDGNDPYQRLDVSIIHENLIQPVLGIDDPKTNPRIDFVGGILGMDELERLVDSGEFTLAISIFPTSLEDVFDVADRNMTMPPKSTWFEPKLRSGLFVHPLDS